MVISDYPSIFFRSYFLSTLTSSSASLFLMHVLSSTSACFPTLYTNTELRSLGVHIMDTQADLNTFNLSHSQNSPRPSIRPSLSHGYITQASLTMCLHNVPARPQHIILIQFHHICFTSSIVRPSLYSSVFSSRHLSRTIMRHPNVITSFNPTFILYSHLVFSPHKPLGNHTDVFNDELNDL